MPTVGVSRDELFKAMGRTYTDEEFDELCFAFGLELDDVTTEQTMERKEKGETVDVADASTEVIYKLDVPANRYDLLCIEGISRALLIFLGKAATPKFRMIEPLSHPRLSMSVKPDVATIRPFIVSAVLRNIVFTPRSYASFIDLQDKLHQNICRKRSLVAIGTHDLDTIEGPFTYDAKPPKDIRFRPLNQEREFDAAELMEFYESDMKLKQFLHIIRDSPVYPVIYDRKGVVLSLPPIINGEHSKIKLSTQNVFIESTATDLTKAVIVLNLIITMFSQYCQNPFTVEPVEVHYVNGKTHVYPEIACRSETLDPQHISELLGVDIDADEMAGLLGRMQLSTTVTEDKKSITVSVPPMRPDILQECDVAEDVAIAYGYNKFEGKIPNSLTIGKQQPIQKLTDLMRFEMAAAGYTEILTFALCSRNENFKLMNREDDGKTAVSLANPKTQEFQIARTSLLPGLAKSLSRNKKLALPLKFFEIADVVLKDETKDVGARNSRRLAAAYMSITSGFELIHGTLDRVMTCLNVKPENYRIVPSNDPTFFTGRQAEVFYKDRRIGIFGIVHPHVLKSFELVYPMSALEIELEPFL